MSRPVVIALLLLVGCKSSPPPAAPPTPVLDHTSQARNPVQVSWQEVRRELTQVELIARVSRLAPLPFPLEVSVALPPGATLIKGRSHFTLAPNAEGATLEEPMVVAYAQTPAGDVELAADGEAIDIGIHARISYRFGRPEPLQPVVKPVGPDLKRGELNLGPSIPISPQAP